MRITYSLICFILFASNVFPCDQSNIQVFITYSYKETQCADPWRKAQTITIDDKKTQLGIFLEKQKIKWKSIEAIKESDVLRTYCEACNCDTGVTFYVTIKRKFSKKIEAIGFKRVK